MLVWRTTRRATATETVAPSIGTTWSARTSMPAPNAVTPEAQRCTSRTSGFPPTSSSLGPATRRMGTDSDRVARICARSGGGYKSLLAGYTVTSGVTRRRTTVISPAHWHVRRNRSLRNCGITAAANSSATVQRSGRKRTSRSTVTDGGTSYVGPENDRSGNCDGDSGTVTLGVTTESVLCAHFVASSRGLNTGSPKMRFAIQNTGTDFYAVFRITDNGASTDTVAVGSTDSLAAAEAGFELARFLAGANGDNPSDIDLQVFCCISCNGRWTEQDSNTRVYRSRRRALLASADSGSYRRKSQCERVARADFRRLMGGTGLEPVTPSLSSWCSPN